MDNDIVFLDDQMRCCGFAAGLSADEQRELCEKYGLHPDTYGNYKKYWRLEE